MSRLANEAYFDYLRLKVDGGNHSKAIKKFLWIALNTEFVWLIPNDDNRVEDALAFRAQYESDFGELVYSPDSRLTRTTASVLEVIVALADHLAFETNHTASSWAKRMLDSLGMSNFSSMTNGDLYWDEALHAFVWRSYRPDGTGGLFPLGFPQRDQRKVELWYQKEAYLEENPTL